MMQRYFLLLPALILSLLVCSQDLTSANYTKKEVRIEMRDGIHLFTSIYSPDDTTQTYPVIIKRTPYSCRPYGEDTIPAAIMHNPDLVASGYIFIIQDMRGRWMSEGKFENTKPPYSWWNDRATDEVTDSYDTFEWIRKNLEHFNGNIGQIGNSYVGHTSLVSAVTDHPNLKAVVAMAPVTDFYFEDFNRYGLFGLSYAPVLDVFGIQKKKPRKKSWYNVIDKSFTKNKEQGLFADYYDYFLEKQSLRNLDDIVASDNFFWEKIKEHRSYDEYRQKRNWVEHIKKARCPTLVVGGWNDEQNLYGILNSFQRMDSAARESDAKLVMGPWSHGHPKRRDSVYTLGDIFYGYNLSKHYQENIELKYFEHHLKEKGTPLDFTAHVFDMGTKKWENFDQNPFLTTENKSFYFHQSGALNTTEPTGEEKFSYVSDPDHPVPFTEDHNFHVMAPKSYMNADQRFCAHRSDVLTFETDELSESMTLRGKIEAMLQFATERKAADLYVKIIDVYPMDRKRKTTDQKNVKYNGYQQLVRAGYIRGRYRNGFEKAKPFQPNKKTEVRVPIKEVYHTFQKGHKIMIQIQSSMFPLYDLNPQEWVDNIYEAEKEDFKQATHSIYSDSEIILPVVR